MIAELEKRHAVAEHAGKIAITAYESRGRMALLDQAVEVAAGAGTTPEVAGIRQYRSRLGALLNVEQELTAELALFARLSKAAGNVEAYEFTDVDRSVSGGLSLKGAAWGRAHDTVGLGLIDNGISAARERYLNAGGLGILIGDGKLPHPGAEQIIETYYDVGLLPHAQLTLDYQFIENPAYNRDRGPVSVWAVRFHTQF
jgi:high affinity Mn2+ porin